MKTKTPKLKPCPFCGNKAQLTRPIERVPLIIANCPICGAKIADSPVNEEDMAKIWNTRAEVYIAHPITGEHMDKSMCKRVITQMSAEIAALKVAVERDTAKDVISDAFVSNGETYERFRCPECKNGLDYLREAFCSSCGQRLNWGEK